MLWENCFRVCQRSKYTFISKDTILCPKAYQMGQLTNKQALVMITSREMANCNIVEHQAEDGDTLPVKTTILGPKCE